MRRTSLAPLDLSALASSIILPLPRLAVLLQSADKLSTKTVHNISVGTALLLRRSSTGQRGSRRLLLRQSLKVVSLLS